MVMGPSDTLFGNCAALLHVDDAAKYMADYEKRVEATNKMANDAKNAAPPTIELEKIKVNGTPAMHVEIGWCRRSKSGRRPNYGAGASRW